MRGAVVLVLVVAGVLGLGACGGEENHASGTSAASATAPRGEPLVIRMRKLVALEERAEPIATGEVLDGSILGDAPFCVGGTLLDSHGSSDPTVLLIIETITCPDGTVKLRLEPVFSPGLKQTGSWTIASGTGTFEQLRGSGKIETVYDPDPTEPAHATLTGTVRR